MSEESKTPDLQVAGVVAAIYAAWNAGDWGLGYLDPDLQWEFMGETALDQSGRMRGREALLAYWRRYWGAWKPGARWDVDEFECLGGGQVLACGRLHAVGRSSGAAVSAEVAQLWTVQRGLVVRLLSCEDRAAALQAAALTH
jgi:ketosteroid isomerase-like protein